MPAMPGDAEMTQEAKQANAESGPVPGLATTPSVGYTEANLPPWRFWILSIGLCLGLFLGMLDSSIVATSLFTIGTEFEALQSVNWVALAYTLSFLGCAVLFARLADIIGRRDAFILSYVTFVAFSIGCGFARNLEQLIALRTLQGMGGSGLYSITMIIFPELTPPRLKKFIASLVGIVIALSGVFGPILGGVLTYYASWRWVFWINGPLGAFAMAIFFLSWPKAEYLPTIEKRPWKELDPVSTTLLIAASVLFVFPFQNAGEEGDIWSHAVFIAPLVAGIVCWIALFGWEYVAEKRCGDKLATAFPLRLMRNRVYAAAAVNMILVGFPFLLVIFAFPLRLQVVSGKDPLLAGVMLLPMLGAAAIGAVAGGMINGSKNHMFGTLLAAACIVLLGSGLMSTLSYSVNVEAKSLGFIATIGFGFGLSTSSSTILAVYESSIRDHAPAQGILAQARILGGSIGIAASSAILGVTLRSQLEGVLTLEQGESLRGPNANLTEVQLAAVRHAFADAFTKDMHVSAVVAGVAVLLVFGTYRKKPLSMEARRAQQTQEEIDRRKNRRGHQVNLATSSSD